MAIVAADEDRVVRSQRVNQPARGELGRGPCLLVPVAPQNPPPRRKCLSLLRYAPHELGFVLRILQIKLQELETAVDEVHVAINETRNSQTSLEIDDLGARPHVSPHFLTAARSEKPSVDDGDSLDQRTKSSLQVGLAGWLARPNLAVEQNQIRAARQLPC